MCVYIYIYIHTSPWLTTTKDMLKSMDEWDERMNKKTEA